MTGLIEEGKGVESFRALLRKDQGDDATINKTDHETASVNMISGKVSQPKVKHQEVLLRLQELSMMFSQEEADVAGRHMRSSDNITDTSSTYKTGVPTSSYPLAKRVIGVEETSDFSLGLAQLNLRHSAQNTLPGIYKHVSIPICILLGRKMLISPTVPPSSSLPLIAHNVRLSISSHPRPPSHKSFLEARRPNSHDQRSTRSFSRWSISHC